MLTNTVFLLVVMLGLSYGVEDKARYDNYRIYRVHLKTQDQVKLFQEIEARSDSYIFMGHAREPNQNLSILAAAHKLAEFTELMNVNQVSYEILDYNFQAKIDAQEKTVKPANTSAAEFGWKNYYQLDTIHAWLDLQCKKYNEILKPLDAGRSYEGVPLKGVKLSMKPNNTAVFVEGGIHAREWISPATSTYILNELLTSQDKEVQNIAKNFDWIFFPVINPDGYKATFEKDRMWRKTRQPFGICRGTDLNRNWDVAWNKTGSSADPCAYDFAGSKVWSERESQQISSLLTGIVKKDRIQTFISLHSFSQLVMFPHGHTSDKAWNYDDLKAIGQKTVEAMKVKYGTQYKSGSVYESIYPSSGASHDWAYSALKIPISFTFELRGPPNSTDWFILPAEQIEPTARETLDGFVAMLKEGEARGYYDIEKILAAQSGSSAMQIKSLSVIVVAIAMIFAYIPVA